MKAKKSAVQHGHPSKALQLIVVAGSSSRVATARLLAEVLRESGKRVAVFTSRGSAIEDIPYVPQYSQNAETAHRALAAARKQRCDVAIVEACGVFAKRHVIATLYIDLAVVLGEGEGVEDLLDQPLKYVVLPSGFDADKLSVAPHQMISVGTDELADARISNVKLYRRGTEVTLTVDHQTVVETATYLVGRSSAISVAFAVAASYVLGVSVDSIPEGVARLEELPGVFQTIEQAEVAYSVVVDCSTAASDVRAVIESAREIAKRRILVVVDGSVGFESLRAIKSDVDRLIGLSDKSEILTDEAGTIEEALGIAKRAAKKDDLVLLIGMDFAKIGTDGLTHAEELLKADKN